MNSIEKRILLWAVACSLAGTCPAQTTLPGIVEVLPTALHSSTIWRYTLDRPGANWTAPDFDDSAWNTGRAGFGTAGTPAIVVNTSWGTEEIWLRREITVPLAGVDPSELQLL